MEQNREQTDWRQYPVYEELLTNRDRYLTIRDRCLRTCQQVGAVLATGSSEDKSLAQRTLNAYGYALDFLDQAIQARDAVLQEDSANRPGGAS